MNYRDRRILSMGDTLTDYYKDFLVGTDFTTMAVTNFFTGASTPLDTVAQQSVQLANSQVTGTPDPATANNATSFPAPVEPTSPTTVPFNIQNILQDPPSWFLPAALVVGVLIITRKKSVATPPPLPVRYTRKK